MKDIFANSLFVFLMKKRLIFYPDMFVLCILFVCKDATTAFHCCTGNLFPCISFIYRLQKHIFPKIIDPTYQYKYITVFLFLLLVIVSKSIEHVFFIWVEGVSNCKKIQWSTDQNSILNHTRNVYYIFNNL